jgi:hypothetical protein
MVFEAVTQKDVRGVLEPGFSRGVLPVFKLFGGCKKTKPTVYRRSDTYNTAVAFVSNKVVNLDSIRPCGIETENIFQPL